MVLLGHLESPSPSVRQNAVEPLVRRGESAVGLTAVRLLHKEGPVRQLAAVVLGRIGPLARGALKPLVVASVDVNADVRTAAVAALAQIDLNWAATESAAAAVPALTNTLADGRTAVVEAAVEMLRQIGGPSVPALATALHDPEPALRAEFRQFWAARTLGLIGPAARQAVPDLIRALGSEHSFVAQAAAEALERIGPACASAVPSLTAALRHDRDDLRQAACGALGRMGPLALEAVPALLRVLSDSHATVRAAAEQTLLRIGPGAASALQQWLVCPADAVRRAKEAGQNQIATLAVGIFLKELKQEYWDVRRHVCNVLNKLREASPEIPAPPPPGPLESLYFTGADSPWADGSVSPSDGRWERLGFSVRQPPPTTAANPLPEDSELGRQFREACHEALGEIVARVVPLLCEQLKNQDPRKRHEAAAELARIGPWASAALPSLRAANDDPHPQVAAMIEKAINGILDNGFGFGFPSRGLP